MAETNTKLTKGLGAGCSGCGCLLLLGAVVVAIMVATGAFNYSAEGQAWASAGTSACCGSMALVLGVVLLLWARHKSKADSTP